MALQIALAMAGAAPTREGSPIPLAPTAWVGSGSSRTIGWISGGASSVCLALCFVQAGQALRQHAKGYALAPKGIVRAHGVVQAQLDRGKAYPVDRALRFCSASLLQ